MIRFIEIIQNVLGPRPRPRASVFFLETDIFSFGLAYHPNAFDENGHRKRIFSKNALQSEEFLKTLATPLLVDGLKLRFSNGRRHASFEQGA